MKRRVVTLFGAAGLLGLVLGAWPPPTLPEAHAEEGGQCALHEIMPIERQLRRASYALRGHPPLLAEYDTIEGLDAIPDATLDDFMEQDSFRTQMRRFHSKYLWPNPTGAQLYNVGITVSSFNIAPGMKAWDTQFANRRREYRGGNGSHRCQNKPQTDLQPSYQLGDRPVCEVKGYDSIQVANAVENRQWCQEGWVLIQPYWEPDPNNKVKVCAFAAQTTESWTTLDEPTDPNDPTKVDTLGEDLNGDAVLDPGEDVNNNGFLDSSGDYDHDNQLDKADADGDGQPDVARCSYLQQDVKSRAGCGCGPRLNFCSQFSHMVPIWISMQEQFLRLVDEHTSGVDGKPAKAYSQILSNNRIAMNGPLLHFYRYWATSAGLGGNTYNALHTGDAPLPSDSAIDFNATEDWTVFERQVPHAGILTLPAYTLRFQTNRGRANRFRIAFMDRYFEPPSVYEQDNCLSETGDLTKKCVCKGCHAVLEPLAAYFGPVAERGSALLTDFVPQFEGSKDGKTAVAQCRDQWKGNDAILPLHRDIVGNQFCGVLYTGDYDPPPPIAHRLTPLYFAADHPWIEDNYDAGPAGLVSLATTNIEGKTYNLLAQATVKHMFEFVLKREMKLDPTTPDSEHALMEQLATDFTNSDDLKSLLKALVKLDTFRRWP